MKHRSVRAPALLLVLTALLLMPRLRGQATVYTASRALEVQVGGSVTASRSNYLAVDVEPNSAPQTDMTRTINLTGGGAYLSVDFRPHFGAEFDYRRLSSNDSAGAYSTYQVAGRYLLIRTERFLPYGRVSYGRGIYQYPGDIASVGFNVVGVGGGTDFHLSTAINLRAEYEWQKWFSSLTQPPKPQGVSVGVAYRFH